MASAVTRHSKCHERHSKSHERHQPVRNANRNETFKPPCQFILNDILMNAGAPDGIRLYIRRFKNCAIEVSKYLFFVTIIIFTISVRIYNRLGYKGLQRKLKNIKLVTRKAPPPVPTLSHCSQCMHIHSSISIIELSRVQSAAALLHNVCLIYSITLRHP